MRRFVLLAVGALSLVLDRVEAYVAPANGIWATCFRLFLPSLLVSAVLYLATGPEGSFRLPVRSIDGDRVARANRAWMVGIPVGVALLGTAIIVALRGRGSLTDAVGFLLTHPLAQVLLFQGALLQLAAGPSLADARDFPFRAMLVVAALQGVSQLEYVHALSWSAVGAVVRVFVLSLLFCSLRIQWGSLWPVLAGYAVNNGLVVYGGRPLGFHF